MSFAPPRSLLTPFPEPLPLYTPRQTGNNEGDSASVRSSAPSYVSAAPSYHSYVPPHHRRAADVEPGSSDNAASPPPNLPQPTGLPATQRYAPGFESRGGDLSNTSVRSLYNISEWVPVTGGLQARHYHNVARRRVTDASRVMFPSFLAEPGNGSRYENTSIPDSFTRRFTAPSLGTGNFGQPEESHNRSAPDLVNTPNPDVAVPRAGTPQNAAGSSSSLELHPWNNSTDEFTPSPLEDPDLVGEAAAARFRSQRLYRARQQEENFHTHPSGSGNRQELRQPTHIYQYSSLITEADNSRALHRPSTAPGLSQQPAEGPQSPRARQTGGRQRSNTIPAEYEEMLRAQESQTWDSMLAQMADWEQRQRSWKRFKEDVDRRLNSGLGWGVRQSSGGRRKLKKEPFGNHPGLKKWKSKVGLAN